MRYKTLELPDGKTISFEIETAPGPQPVSKLGETIEAARKSVGKSFEAIREFTQMILAELRAGLESAAPDTVEITFGVKLSAELGNFIVAKAGAEAHYAVTLKWNSVASMPGEYDNAGSGSNSNPSSNR